MSHGCVAKRRSPPIGTLSTDRGATYGAVSAGSPARPESATLPTARKVFGIARSCSRTAVAMSAAGATATDGLSGAVAQNGDVLDSGARSEEDTAETQSLMRHSYAGF